MTPAVPKVSTLTVNVETLIRNPRGAIRSRCGGGASFETERRLRRADIRSRLRCAVCTTLWEFVSAVGTVAKECGCLGAGARLPLSRVNRTFVFRRAAEKRTVLCWNRRDARRTRAPGCGACATFTPNCAVYRAVTCIPERRVRADGFVFVSPKSCSARSTGGATVRPLRQGRRCFGALRTL
jgi:hypothetical protein